MVPKYCECMMGPKYALLRPEFARWRDKSLERRRDVTKPKNILVSLGGVDPENISTDVINQLSLISTLADAEVNVVLGSQSKYVSVVKMAAENSCLKVNVHVDTNRMAEIMCKADLAIGACGSTSWERCALGLPSICYVTADNQVDIALALEKAEAVIIKRDIDELSSVMNSAIQNLKKMSVRSSLVCDGFGAKHVSIFLGNNTKPSGSNSM